MLKTSLTLSRDRNGNKTLRVSPQFQRGFSIQTIGNLPLTHRSGLCPETMGEVLVWVERCGTARQRAVMALAVESIV